MSAPDSFDAYQASCLALLPLPVNRLDAVEVAAIQELVRCGFRIGFSPELVSDLIRRPGSSAELAGATRRHRIAGFAQAVLPAILSHARLATLSSRIGLPVEVLAAQAAIECAMALDDALGELGNSDVAAALFGKTR